MPLIQDRLSSKTSSHGIAVSLSKRQAGQIGFEMQSLYLGDAVAVPWSCGGYRVDGVLGMAASFQAAFSAPSPAAHRSLLHAPSLVFSLFSLLVSSNP